MAKESEWGASGQRAIAIVREMWARSLSGEGELEYMTFAVRGVTAQGAEKAFIKYFQLDSADEKEFLELCREPLDLKR